MNIVDFTEIASPMDWELFAQAFFRSKEFVIVEGPSSGGDSGTGKDLIIEKVITDEFGEIKRRFLVSCKHYAHSGDSVNASDEKDNILTNLVSQNCSGFIGFYSTIPSSPLQQKIKNLKESKILNINVSDYYDREKIEHYLLYEDKNCGLLKRFFKNSYKEWASLGKKDVEENSNLKKLKEEDFITKDKDYFKKYYDGQPADWSIIRKYTFKRESLDLIIGRLETNKISLLTGAGGEGKTTLLMQVGDYYLKNEYNVFYSFDAIQNINISELRFKPNKKYLLIIDNANTIVNLTEFIKKIKLSNGILVLLASRKNEWDYSLSIRTDSEDLNRWIGKPIILHKLSNNELTELTVLLQKHKVLNEEVKEKLPQFIKENTNFNFLLSVMVYATQGKSFDLIIADVINKIQGWKNSELTINSIGYIVCIEILGKGNHGIIHCQETLLKKLLNVTNNNQYSIIKKQLAEEAFFQGSLTNIINTRNPIIAKIYFDYLFYDETPILDKYTFYYDIIRETSNSSSIFDKDILGLLPKYFFKKDRNLAIQLLKDAISHGFFWNTYYQFIDNEISEGNFGSYNSEEYSARWLFEKAFQRNSKDPLLYTRWAQFELKQSDIGNIKFEYTPRWIFYTGMKLAPFDNLFVLWAKEEIRVNNLGENIDTEYSARWICEQGISKTPSCDLFLTWANIEADSGNIGIDINDEYSARWICKQGMDLKPTKDIFITWAKIEINVENIGKDVNDKYSARWICKQGISMTPSSDLFIIWAHIEADSGNIGIDVNDEYSARWICKQGIIKSPTGDLFSSWANIEFNAGNIGKDVNDEYSARWICMEGISKTPTNDLFNVWANLEVNCKNIGKDVNEEYTARWICKQVFDKTQDTQCLYKWLKIELYQNNIGDSDKPNTAQWIFEIYVKTIKLNKLTYKGVEINTALEFKEILEKMSIDNSIKIDSISDIISE
jgi:hypothetical protein